jgi:hypothetical protein
MLKYGWITLIMGSALMATAAHGWEGDNPPSCQGNVCNTIVCSRECTNPQNGEVTTCGEYHNWECTHECVRGAPTHYTYVNTYHVYVGGPGVAQCDQYIAYKEHYTDSCGNQFYKCVSRFDRPAICNFSLPSYSLCSGGI